MGMTAENHALGIDLECYENRSSPALDQSDTERVGGGVSHFDPMRVGRQSLEHELYQLTGLHQLIKPYSNACGNVTFLAHDFGRHERVIRRPRKVDSRIEWLPARAAGKADEPEPSCERMSVVASCISTAK